MSIEVAKEELSNVLGATANAAVGAAGDVARGTIDGVKSAPGAAYNAANNNMFGGAENPLAFYLMGLGAAVTSVAGSVTSGVINGATTLVKAVPSVVGSGIKALGAVFTSAASASAPAENPVSMPGEKPAADPLVLNLGNFSPPPVGKGIGSERLLS